MPRFICGGAQHQAPGVREPRPRISPALELQCSGHAGHYEARLSMPSRSCAAALIIAMSCSVGIQGSGSAEPVPASGVNACSLLTVTEISQAIGRPVDAGRRDDSGVVDGGGFSSTCVWDIQLRTSDVASGSPHAARSFVILNAIRWPAESGKAATFLESFREAARAGEILTEPAPREFGEEALWWGDGLAVRQGDVSFGISVFAPAAEFITTRKRGDIEEKLAPYIVRRLAVLRL